MKSTRKFRGVIAVAAAVSLLAAACGDDEPDATETTEAEAAAPATDAPMAPETTMAEDDGRHDHGRRGDGVVRGV